MKEPDSTKFLKRQYMLENSFEIYYYEDFPTSGVDPHSHNFFEFYFFLEGKVAMTIKDHTYAISPGDLIMIPPDTVHYPSIMDHRLPYRRFVLWIRTDYYLRTLAQTDIYKYLFDYCIRLDQPLLSMSQPLFNDLQIRIFGLIRETHDARFGKEAACRLLLQSLLLEIGRFVYSQKHNGHISQASLRSRICSYIDDHLSSPLSLDQLSQIFYLNKYYLAHTFKETMGISIHQYILKKRLKSCINAMVTEATMDEIASQLGFASYSSFYRHFKKEFGISPSEYRSRLSSHMDPMNPS